MVYLGRPYHFIFFKGSLPQILLGPFLNTLTHLLKKSLIENFIFCTVRFVQCSKLIKLNEFWLVFMKFTIAQMNILALDAYFFLLLTLLITRISESCIKIKISLKFYFHIFTLIFPQRSAKINI